jgi:hypothetical protein
MQTPTANQQKQKQKRSCHEVGAGKGARDSRQGENKVEQSLASQQR